MAKRTATKGGDREKGKPKAAGKGSTAPVVPASDSNSGGGTGGGTKSPGSLSLRGGRKPETQSGGGQGSGGKGGFTVSGGRKAR